MKAHNRVKIRTFAKCCPKFIDRRFFLHFYIFMKKRHFLLEKGEPFCLFFFFILVKLAATFVGLANMKGEED